MTPSPRILMVAYHFPPIQGSSGVHRSISFARCLAEQGWSPTVLSVTRNALFNWSAENERMVPDGVRVIRALAFDTMRHLTVKEKYPGFLAIPDRWVSWVVAGVAAGLAHILRHRPAVIFSTYPIASAHLIAYLLHRISGTPWIADFRDPMAQDGYPPDPRVWRAFRGIEERVFAHAARVLFTAPGALDYYCDIFGEGLRERSVVIQNGYDEALFRHALDGIEPDTIRREGPLRLVHAGILYPGERDPRQFFAAIRDLMDEGIVRRGEVEISLRGSGHDAHYLPLLKELGLGDVVRFEPAVGYAQALLAMQRADGLLLFQAADCNFQIPAKVYEYFRTRRPIIAFTDPQGDTAQLLRQAGVGWVADLQDRAEIAATLRDALGAIRRDRDARYLDESFVAACAREQRAREFVRVVEEVAR